MKILALLDGRPGNDNQTIAIAEKLGEYESLTVEFGFWAKLPNFLLGKSQRGVKTKIEAQPDVIIAAGRKLARVSAHIKAKQNCKALQLMHPHMPLKWFDLIFVPEHDGYKTHGNLRTTIGAPNRIDEELLAEQDWNFVEGANVALVGNIEPEDAKLLHKVENLHISTSRRTTKEAVEALKALEPKYMYEWNAKTENPYYGLLAAAENIIVSADSVGMISEACTTGKKVFVFAKPSKRKFKKFIKKLEKLDCLKPIKQFRADWQPKKLATRDEVVIIIKNYIES